jgi:putative resolvase
VNLSEWVRLPGIGLETAYRWFREGTLPVPAVRGSPRSVLVAPDAAVAVAGEGPGLYARVSSCDQEAGLGRQVARLAAWAVQAGQPAARTAAGSGMSGSRAKARRLLAGPGAGTVVAGHRGRLGRMNTGLVEAALSASGRRPVRCAARDVGPASPGVSG